MSLTREVVPTTSIDRRVSATAGRTSNASGVGFVLSKTLAITALSNTGVRVGSCINRSGVFVFNLGGRRILRCRTSRDCRSDSCCTGSPVLRHILSTFISKAVPSVNTRNTRVFGSLIRTGSRCFILHSFRSCLETRNRIRGACHGPSL